MLKLFRDARTAKLVKALQHGDRETLARLGRKIETHQLSEPLHEGQNAIELCLAAGQHQALEWVLERHPDAAGSTTAGIPYSLEALRQPQQSLALLSVLLKAGADADTRFGERSLLHWCFEHCAPAELMLHLSRLVQHGATLEDAGDLVALTMTRGDQATVHFLIHSGAPLPEDLDAVDCSDDLRAYARRCADDKRIREMMLGR